MGIRTLITAVLTLVLGATAWTPPAGAAGETCRLPGTDLAAWQEIFRKDDITVYAMETPNSPIMAFRATGTLNAHISQVMEVLRKVEIAEQWMPDLVEKRTIDNVSDMEAVTYSINKLPWPFAGREMVLRNALRLDTRSRSLVVDVYSVDRPDLVPRKGTVRAVMHCGQTLLRPAGGDRTAVDIILFVDPKGSIPAWLANFAQRQMPYNFLKSLERKASTTSYPLRPAFRSLLDRLIALLDSDPKTAVTPQSDKQARAPIK